MKNLNQINLADIPTPRTEEAKYNESGEDEFMVVSAALSRELEREGMILLAALQAMVNAYGQRGDWITCDATLSARAAIIQVKGGAK